MFVASFNFVCKPLLPQNRLKNFIRHPTQCSFPVLNKGFMGGSDDNGSGSSDDGNRSGSQSTRHSFTSPGLQFANCLQLMMILMMMKLRAPSIHQEWLFYLSHHPTNLVENLLRNPLLFQALYGIVIWLKEAMLMARGFGDVFIANMFSKVPLMLPKPRPNRLRSVERTSKPVTCHTHKIMLTCIGDSQWEETKGKKVERKHRVEWEKQHGEARANAGVEDLIARGTSRAG